MTRRRIGWLAGCVAVIGALGAAVATPQTPAAGTAIPRTADGRPDPEFPGGLPDIYATIGDIVSRKKKGRESDQERIIAIPIGMAICDVALAHLIYQTAIEKNVGRRLNLM